MERCTWPANNPLMIAYHDKEWGVPVHDDHKHFEFMVLDTFQAGLSWSVVLKKREGFRKAFDGFRFEKIASYDESKIQELLVNEEIIRNRLKIRATVNNARCFLEIRKEFGSFDRFIWSFTGHKTIVNKWKFSMGLDLLFISCVREPQSFQQTNHAPFQPPGNKYPGRLYRD